MAVILRSCTGCTSENPKLNQAKHFGLYQGGHSKKGLLEAISKIGFWFKIAAWPSFKPEVRLRRIEDLKRGTNKDIGPKDIFEMASTQSASV
jgi:hypothetical protein